MSSISGMSAKPPTDSKAARATKIAWSPVAMPVRRERAFISAATTGSSGWRPAIRTSNRPQTRPVAASASRISRSALGGQARVGVQEHAGCRRRPPARRRSSGAPGREARPGQVGPGRARATVSSWLPPSTMTTMAPRARNGASASRQPGMLRGFVERRHHDGEPPAGPGRARRRHRPRLNGFRPLNSWLTKFWSAPPAGVVRLMKSKIRAVLDAVERDALDLQVLVEIDRGDALVDDALTHELQRPLRDLADVVPALVADRRHGRGRAERLQHLLGAHAGLDLADGALVDQVAAMEVLADMQPPTDRATRAAHRRRTGANG